MFSQQRRIMNLKLALFSALLVVALVLGACGGGGTGGGDNGGDSGGAPAQTTPEGDTGGAATPKPY